METIGDLIPWYIGIFVLWMFLTFCFSVSFNSFKTGFKKFFIWWAVSAVVPVSFLLYATFSHCSGEQCMGNAVVFYIGLLGLGFLVLIFPAILGIAKLVRVDDPKKVSTVSTGLSALIVVVFGAGMLFSLHAVDVYDGVITILANDLWYLWAVLGVLALSLLLVVVYLAFRDNFLKGSGWGGVKKWVWALGIYVIAVSLLLVLDSDCSGFDCLGTTILLFCTFFGMLFIFTGPPLVFGLAKLFKVESWKKFLWVSLMFSAIVIGFLVGIVKFVDYLASSDAYIGGGAGPSITPIPKVAEEVAEEAEEEEAEEAPAANPVVTADESDIELIREYYGNLWVDRVEEAYAMKHEPAESFATFKGWYENTFSATPYDFKAVADHRYRFFVNLIENDGTNERYDVTMEVVDGKLKTISSKKIEYAVLGDAATFDGSLSAHSEWKQGEEFLYIEKDGGRYLVDLITERVELNDKVATFADLRFSKSGKYLMYMVYGWEGAWLKVCDVDSGIIVYTVGTSGGFVDFTDDEKHLYFCEGTGMSSGAIRAMSVPGFQLEKDIFKDYQSEGGYSVGAGGECEYHAGTNSLKYSLWMMNGGAGDEVVWEVYYF